MTTYKIDISNDIPNSQKVRYLIEQDMVADFDWDKAYSYGLEYEDRNNLKLFTKELVREKIVSTKDCFMSESDYDHTEHLHSLNYNTGQSYATEYRYSHQDKQNYIIPDDMESMRKQTPSPLYHIVPDEDCRVLIAHDLYRDLELYRYKGKDYSHVSVKALARDYDVVVYVPSDKEIDKGYFPGGTSCVFVNPKFKVMNDEEYYEFRKQHNADYQPPRYRYEFSDDMHNIKCIENSTGKVYKNYQSKDDFVKEDTYDYFRNIIQKYIYDGNKEQEKTQIFEKSSLVREIVYSEGYDSVYNYPDKPLDGKIETVYKDGKKKQQTETKYEYDYEYDDEYYVRASWVKETKKQISHFDDREQVVKIVSETNEHIDSVEYYTNCKLKRREDFDEEGNHSRTTFYNLKDKKAKQIDYNMSPDKGLLQYDFVITNFDADEKVTTRDYYLDGELQKSLTPTQEKIEERKVKIQQRLSESEEEYGFKVAHKVAEAVISGKERRVITPEVAKEYYKKVRLAEKGKNR